MAFRVSRDGISTLVQVSALTALTIIVLFIRRPDQFLHPYVWVEDGQYILKEFADQGAWTLTIPLAGYYVLATKVLSVIAYKVSILWAPEIELILIVAFTCAVVVAVAFSPTHLRWRFLCAVALLLIPSESEVFAVSSYAIWWAGVLLLLAVLWDPNGGREWLRWLFIVFGGLSSPIIVPIAVLLALRATVERQRSEYVAFGLAAIVTIVQFLGMRSQGVHVDVATVAPTLPFLIVQTYVGNFFYADHGAYVGYAILALLIFALWSVRSRLDRYFFLLVLTFIFVAASSSIRNSGYVFSFFQPIVYAPRYYFYPFITLAWIMIWVAALSGWPVRLGFAAAFATALVVAQVVQVNGIGLSRRQDPIDWRKHILACAQSTEYDLPIHYIGHANDMWHVQLTGDECKRLLDQSLF